MSKCIQTITVNISDPLDTFYKEQVPNSVSQPSTFTLELVSSVKPFVKLYFFSFSIVQSNFLFLCRAPSVVLKRPIVFSMGVIELMFPGHICQAGPVSCHLDLSNYFPLWGALDRGADGLTDRSNMKMECILGIIAKRK